MTDPTDVDDLVRGFAMLLDRCWDIVERTKERTATGSFVQDWLQANWEMLVEGAYRPRDVFLEPYGDGADCNGASSRVYRPELVSTHAVCVVARAVTDSTVDVLNDEEVVLGRNGLPLNELVSREGRWFARKPPFNLTHVQDGPIERLFSLDDVRFVVRPVHV